MIFDQSSYRLNVDRMYSKQQRRQSGSDVRHVTNMAEHVYKNASDQCMESKIYQMELSWVASS